MNEINRILKPNGICAITFGQKKYLEKLPFVLQKFKLYDNDDFQKIVNLSIFELIEIIEQEEEIESKIGTLVNRKYSIVILRKTPTITPPPKDYPQLS